VDHFASTSNTACSLLARLVREFRQPALSELNLLSVGMIAIFKLCVGENKRAIQTACRVHALLFACLEGRLLVYDTTAE
jgi:hypothetical protein